MIHASGYRYRGTEILKSVQGVTGCPVVNNNNIQVPTIHFHCCICPFFPQRWEPCIACEYFTMRGYMGCIGAVHGWICMAEFWQL